MNNFRVVLRLNMACVGITIVQYESFQSQDSFYLRIFAKEYTYYVMNMSLLGAVLRVSFRQLSRM